MEFERKLFLGVTLEYVRKKSIKAVVAAAFTQGWPG